MELALITKTGKPHWFVVAHTIENKVLATFQREPRQGIPTPEVQAELIQQLKEQFQDKDVIVYWTADQLIKANRIQMGRMKLAIARFFFTRWQPR